MEWKIGEAKERFSQLVRAAAEEPQLVVNRGRLVAAVIDAPTFYAFKAWQENQARTTLADVFATLRELCAEEGYQFEPAPRRDRPNMFVDALDNFSV